MRKQRAVSESVLEWCKTETEPALFCLTNSSHSNHRALLSPCRVSHNSSRVTLHSSQARNGGGALDSPAIAVVFLVPLSPSLHSLHRRAQRWSIIRIASTRSAPQGQKEPKHRLASPYGPTRPRSKPLPRPSLKLVFTSTPTLTTTTTSHASHAERILQDGSLMTIPSQYTTRSVATSVPGLSSGAREPLVTGGTRLCGPRCSQVF